MDQACQIITFYFQSWTYWDFAPFWNKNGDLVKDLVSVFSRPYPIATAGSPQKLTYDPTSKEFYYEFRINNAIRNNYPTEIFVPPMTYPNSQFEIEMSDFLSWEFSPDDHNVIFVSQTKANDNLKMNISVYLKISPLVNVHILGG